MNREFALMYLGFLILFVLGFGIIGYITDKLVEYFFGEKDRKESH